MKNTYLYLIVAFLITACTSQQKGQSAANINTPSLLGRWVVNMDLGNGEYLPFELNFESESSAKIINGDENIFLQDITRQGDSIFISLPVFDSEIKAKLVVDKTMTGAWYNHAKGANYKILFTADRSDQPRFSFESNKESSIAFTGQKWQVTFSPNTDDSYDAIGVFKEDSEGRLSGTFMTETGDYRYLSGNRSGNEIMLSCFDGSHAFLFTGTIDDKNKISGVFCSGTHWKEPWKAVQNDDVELADPYELTYLKEGYDGVIFQFPDLDSTIVSYPNQSQEGKVVLVQVIGSWCPNCMDETRLLNNFIEKYPNSQLEVIGLCFEVPNDFNGAVRNIRRMQASLDVKYTLLYAGKASKSEAAKKLPMLNHIMSYPTLIFIDKKGTIRKIHTGFYGPGTGERYNQTVSEFTSLLDQLINE